jgi:hypothetical protein
LDRSNSLAPISIVGCLQQTLGKFLVLPSQHGKLIAKATIRLSLGQPLQLKRTVPVFLGSILYRLQAG